MNKKMDADIKFLEKRIQYCIKTEQYEKAAVLKKWLEEIKEKK